MPTATSQVVSQLQRSIARAIFGKEDVIQLALVTLLARGHLLIEDVPGVGKTTLAQALAKSFHCTFQRIQFTSDLLPSDVLGVSVYNPESREFEFRHGRFLPMSFWPTKSIAPRLARNPLCWKR